MGWATDVGGEGTACAKFWISVSSFASRSSRVWSTATLTNGVVTEEAAVGRVAVESKWVTCGFGLKLGRKLKLESGGGYVEKGIAFAW